MRIKTTRQAAADMNLARMALSVLPDVGADPVGIVMARTSLPRHLAVQVARFGLRQPAIPFRGSRWDVPLCWGRYIWHGMVDEGAFRAAHLELGWDETRPGIFHAPAGDAMLRYKDGEVILLVEAAAVLNG